MTPIHVTPDQIAAVSGLTLKHIRRQLTRARGAGPYISTDWFGRRIQIIHQDGVVMVAFATLPDHIREAFVMRDQPELPLPPPRTELNLNNPIAPTLH